MNIKTVAEVKKKVISAACFVFTTSDISDLLN